MRVAAAMGLLVASKALNVGVPVLFKYAVDGLSLDPTGALGRCMASLKLHDGFDAFNLFVMSLVCCSQHTTPLTCGPCELVPCRSFFTW